MKQTLYYLLTLHWFLKRYSPDILKAVLKWTRSFLKLCYLSLLKTIHSSILHTNMTFSSLHLNISGTFFPFS